MVDGNKKPEEGPPHPDEGYIGRGPEILATAFFFVLFAFAIGALVYLIWAYVTDIILAALFAAVTLPMHRWLTPKVGGRAWVSAALTSLVVLVGVAGPTAFLVTSLTVEAGAAIDATRESVSLESVEDALFGEGRLAVFLSEAAERLGVDYTPDAVKKLISNTAGSIAKLIYNQINVILSNVLAGIFHFLLIILMLYYFLLDGRQAKRYLFRLSPLPDEEEELLAEKFGDVGRAVFFGNGIGSVLQGVLGGIAMAVVGLPSPVLWATVMSIFAFLPLVGIGVVVVPATVYLALTGRYLAAILFFAFCMGEGVFVENVVKTKLIGDHMKMHNMVIFMALIAGITVFGVLGLLYGPLLVVLFTTLSELYRTHYQFRFMSEAETAAAETVTIRPEDLSQD